MTTSLALSLSLALPLVSAGLFPAGGPVKSLQDAQFKQVLKAERTAVVAFVAPWCGHCKKLTPEFTRAAESLSPLIDFYSVDCDAEVNKRICAEQGVQGFPTIKSFPRGTKGAPHVYNGERIASSIVSWASSEVPSRVTSLKGDDAVSKWSKKESTQPRALLITSQAKVPVMWKVLGSRYSKSLAFGAVKDADGAIAKALELSSGDDGKSKVAIWEAGAEAPTLYDGKMKFEPLSAFFETLALTSEPSHPKAEL